MWKISPYLPESFQGLKSYYTLRTATILNLRVTPKEHNLKEYIFLFQVNLNKNILKVSVFLSHELYLLPKTFKPNMYRFFCEPRNLSHAYTREALYHRAIPPSNYHLKKKKKKTLFSLNVSEGW